MDRRPFLAPDQRGCEVQIGKSSGLSAPSENVYNLQWWAVVERSRDK